jgi:SAM-dependent methyltransferase
MTQPADTGPAPALRCDAWSDSAWGRYAWRVQTRAVLGALGPLAGRRVADIGCGTGRLLGILTSHQVVAREVNAADRLLQRGLPAVPARVRRSIPGHSPSTR